MDLTNLLKSISKALAAAIAGFITAWLMKRNIVIADNLPDIIETLLSALVSFVVVYLAPKNTEAK